MTDHPVVSREEWVKARTVLMDKEREFTRARDALTRERQALPWVEVDKEYRFTGPSGRLSFADLFKGCSQLAVYHFMFAADWDEGCPSCSFWADNYNGTSRHLAARDVALAAVSSAPIDKLMAYKLRLGWSFDWYSAAGGDFNQDYHVSFTPELRASGSASYNFRPALAEGMSELPGFSCFYKADDGVIYHTYSVYARGLEDLNGAYRILDTVAKGRNESNPNHAMDWVRRNDQY